MSHLFYKIPKSELCLYMAKAADISPNADILLWWKTTLQTFLTGLVQLKMCYYIVQPRVYNKSMYFFYFTQHPGGVQVLVWVQHFLHIPRWLHFSEYACGAAKLTNILTRPMTCKVIVWS